MTTSTVRPPAPRRGMLHELRRTLAIPAVYRVFARSVGTARGREGFSREYIRARAGDRVLDIGCGPGDVLQTLPRVEYVGFDANPAYIEAATKSFGDRAKFYCQHVNAESLSAHSEFDIVLAMSILHHIDETEAEHLFALARSALKPGGRLVTVDPVYVDGQSPIARFLISRDRGEHVRTGPGYEALAKRVFSKVTATVRDDMMRVPYTHFILECEK